MKSKKILIVSVILIAVTIFFLNLKSRQPDENSLETLSGIDSDNNGVRDDVQIWIEQKYSKPEKLKVAYTDYALVQQNLMRAIENNTLSSNHLQAKYNALDCLSFLQPRRLANDIALELDLITLNTSDRLETSKKEWELIDEVDNSVKVSELGSKCSERVKSTQ